MGSRFPELRRTQMEFFLKAHSRQIRYGNNKWVGVTTKGIPFCVHEKHGTTKKFPPTLVEDIVTEMGFSYEEFIEWYKK